MKEKENVLKHIKEEPIVELAKELIKIPSMDRPPFYEAECTKFLAKFMEERGFDVKTYQMEPRRLQCLGKLKGTGDGLSLIFNGHIDNECVWVDDVEPWTPEVIGRRLYGHGIRNMKAGVAAMVMAAVAIKEAGVELKGDLIIEPVCGEIQEGSGTMYFLKQGITADMAVVPEPTGETLRLIGGETWEFAIHTIGRSTLRGFGDGVNALEKMLKVIDALKKMKWKREARSELPPPVLTIGSIIGGRSRPGLNPGSGAGQQCTPSDYDLAYCMFTPEFCTIVTDVCGPPGLNIYKQVEEMLEKMKKKDPQFRYELEVAPDNVDFGQLPGLPFENARCRFPSYEISENEYILKIIKKAHKEVTGQEPQIRGPLWRASGDMHHLQMHGISSVTYGPIGGRNGSESFNGGRKDWIDIDSMVRVTKVLALTALEVCTKNKSRH